MKLFDLLELAPGERVAVVGCGGKTGVVELLFGEAAPLRALIAPTTRILPPPPGVFCLGVPDPPTGKLLAAPLEEIKRASADCDITLMEADGSRALPLKGWADWEPVVPAFTTLTLGVVGARALGLSATGEHVHRLDRFLALTDLDEGDVVDARAIARMILAPGGMLAKAVGRTALLINQADAQDALPIARAVRAQSNLPIFVGSVWQKKWEVYR